LEPIYWPISRFNTWRSRARHMMSSFAIMTGMHSKKASANIKLPSVASRFKATPPPPPTIPLNFVYTETKQRHQASKRHAHLSVWTGGWECVLLLPKYLRRITVWIVEFVRWSLDPPPPLCYSTAYQLYHCPHKRNASSP
jgi:hypothetical protein